MRRLLILPTLALTLGLLSACGAATVVNHQATQDAALSGGAGRPVASAEDPTAAPTAASTAQPSGTASAPSVAQAAGSAVFPAPAQRAPGAEAAGDTRVPGVGPKSWAKIPKTTTQLLVSSTPKSTDSTATTVLYIRDAEGTWEKTKSWKGHNGDAGWRAKRLEGDKTSPAGVFALTDAGGSLPDPGSKLPYTRESAYRTEAQATYGPTMKNVFNYVIAINYNRKAGTPPSDDTHPEGAAKGGKIWLHVDHDGPTHGCVTIPQDGVEYLLKTLDPKQKPMIVMGSAKDIAA